MLQAFYTSDAGLKANEKWLSVISDNIANVNTIGFKAEIFNFEDMLANNLTSFANGAPKNVEIGGGSFLGSTVKDFSQGSFKTSNNPTDLALDGEGFFMVKDQQGVTYYTRAGQFRTDKDGNLINVNGMFLQGWSLDKSGNISGPIDKINIPSSMDPNVTTKLTLKSPTNLDASSPLITKTFDTSDSSSYSYVNSITIYDSLGISHEFRTYFVHEGPNKWRVFALVDDEPVQFKVPGDTNTYDSLYVEFNGVGQLNLIKGYGVDTSQTETNVTETTDPITGADLGKYQLANTPVLPGSVVITQYTVGATNTAVNWIDDGKGNIIDLDKNNEIIGSIKYSSGEILINKFSGSGQTENLTNVKYKTYNNTKSTNKVLPDSIGISPIVTNNQHSATLNTGGNPINFTINLSKISQLKSEFIFYAEQDGYAKGDLLSVSVSEDGVIKSVYTNGQVRNIARIAIATFKDKEVLVRKGSNLFIPNSQTFTPIIVPGGVISKIRGGFLELSNVDIAKEFMNLISAQRAYQANAKSVTTAYEVLQETMNIKR